MHAHHFSQSVSVDGHQHVSGVQKRLYPAHESVTSSAESCQVDLLSLCSTLFVAGNSWLGSVSALSATLCRAASELAGVSATEC